MRSDTVFKGIVVAFVAFAAYSISDACVKLIEGGISPYESGFFGAVFGIFALPFLMKRGDSWRDIFRTTNRPLWILRFFSAGAGIIGSVTAFTHLSMAEAFCLIFLLPSFVTIMSVVFLKESVGLKRWSAVLIGFLGVLVVLRPGFRELSIGHVGAVFGGLSGAVSIIIYRAIGPQEKNISLYGAGLLGGLIICGLAMLPEYRNPTGEEWLYLAGYGILGAVGNILLMYASFYAPAAIVGPIQYSQMLWAIALGYLMFGDRIDTPMLVGIALIIGSGLLTLSRERTRGVPLPPPVAGKGEAALAIKPETDDA
ncbi:DMT family transporter [Ciceribacter sp. L1K22]|uniref:DMT family transporter n=1 Tax=Ciceribacter sp. L1K22 TaxID=2820275 RepID=UPI001ABDEA40|nr:DMT family transporter [Ciceribacter sp. L1K22]MBO3760301.1 DMT family transporter [Ciceribacter sp. L1K22]